MKTEEQEYIKRILGGEMELYGYFLDTYGHRIFTQVQQMVSNREDAEDITQDIFVKAYESLKRYRGDCEFITWIYRIACNVTASILRKNKQRQEYLSFDGNIPEHIGNDESEIPFDIIDENEPDERIEDLQLAISWLSAEERALITLFYYENKSIEDCAYILQQSEGNIKVRLHRVRKKLSLYLYRIKYGNEPIS